MNAPLGTLHTVDGRPVLRFERQLRHPPEKVWRAITDPAEMAHWFPAQIEAELRPGARMRFSFGDDDVDLGGEYADGEILELDRPKVYAFRWVDSVLRFELIPDAAGCRLVFTHTLSGTGTAGDRPSAARNASGWDACLALLTARLDERPAPSMESGWWLERAERYVEEFGLGEGELRETDEGYLVRFERDLMQAPGEVWAALTGPAAPAVGSAPDVRFTNAYVPAGAVTEVERVRVLEYAWLHDDVPAGRVRFELRDQKPIGTRLVVTQTLPRELARLRATVLSAWQTHLELFFAALHGDVRCPWPTGRTDQLAKMYADRYGGTGPAMLGTHVRRGGS